MAPSERQTQKLIGLYRSCECLWNAQSPGYHSRSVQEDAWRKITRGMNSGLTPDQVKLQVLALRNYYDKECAAIRQSKLKGYSYVPQQSYFEDLLFLGDGQWGETEEAKASFCLGQVNCILEDSFVLDDYHAIKPDFPQRYSPATFCQCSASLCNLASETKHGYTLYKLILEPEEPSTPREKERREHRSTSGNDRYYPTSYCVQCNRDKNASSGRQCQYCESESASSMEDKGACTPQREPDQKSCCSCSTESGSNKQNMDCQSTPSCCPPSENNSDEDDCSKNRVSDRDQWPRPKLCGQPRSKPEPKCRRVATGRDKSCCIGNWKRNNDAVCQGLQAQLAGQRGQKEEGASCSRKSRTSSGSCCKLRNRHTSGEDQMNVLLMKNHCPRNGNLQAITCQWPNNQPAPDAGRYNQPCQEPGNYHNSHQMQDPGPYVNNQQMQVPCPYSNNQPMQDPRSYPNDPAGQPGQPSYPAGYCQCPMEYYQQQPQFGQSPTNNPYAGQPPNANGQAPQNVDTEYVPCQMVNEYGRSAYPEQPNVYCYAVDNRNTWGQPQSGATEPAQMPMTSPQLAAPDSRISPYSKAPCASTTDLNNRCPGDTSRYSEQAPQPASRYPEQAPPQPASRYREQPPQPAIRYAEQPPQPAGRYPGQTPPQPPCMYPEQAPQQPIRYNGEPTQQCSRYPEQPPQPASRIPDEPLLAPTKLKKKSNGKPKDQECKAYTVNERNNQWEPADDTRSSPTRRRYPNQGGIADEEDIRRRGRNDRDRDVCPRPRKHRRELDHDDSGPRSPNFEYEQENRKCRRKDQTIFSINPAPRSWKKRHYMENESQESQPCNRPPKNCNASQKPIDPPDLPSEESEFIECPAYNRQDPKECPYQRPQARSQQDREDRIARKTRPPPRNRDYEDGGAPSSRSRRRPPPKESESEYESEDERAPRSKARPRETKKGKRRNDDNYGDDEAPKETKKGKRRNDDNYCDDEASNREGRRKRQERNVEKGEDRRERGEKRTSSKKGENMQPFCTVDTCPYTGKSLSEMRSNPKDPCRKQPSQDHNESPKRKPTESYSDEGDTNGSPKRKPKESYYDEREPKKTVCRKPPRTVDDTKDYDRDDEEFSAYRKSKKKQAPIDDCECYSDDNNYAQRRYRNDSQYYDEGPDERSLREKSKKYSTRSDRNESYQNYERPQRGYRTENTEEDCICNDEYMANRGKKNKNDYADDRTCSKDTCEIMWAAYNRNYSAREESPKNREKYKNCEDFDYEQYPNSSQSSKQNDDKLASTKPSKKSKGTDVYESENDCICANEEYDQGSAPPQGRSPQREHNIEEYNQGCNQSRSPLREHNIKEYSPRSSRPEYRCTQREHSNEGYNQRCAPPQSKCPQRVYSNEGYNQRCAHPQSRCPRREQNIEEHSPRSPPDSRSPHPEGKTDQVEHNIEENNQRSTPLRSRSPHPESKIDQREHTKEYNKKSASPQIRSPHPESKNDPREQEEYNQRSSSARSRSPQAWDKQEEEGPGENMTNNKGNNDYKQERPREDVQDTEPRDENMYCKDSPEAPAQTKKSRKRRNSANDPQNSPKDEARARKNDCNYDCDCNKEGNEYNGKNPKQVAGKSDLEAADVCECEPLDDAFEPKLVASSKRNVAGNGNFALTNNPFKNVVGIETSHKPPTHSHSASKPLGASNKCRHDSPDPEEQKMGKADNSLPGKTRMPSPRGAGPSKNVKSSRPKSASPTRSQGRSRTPAGEPLKRRIAARNGASPSPNGRRCHSGAKRTMDTAANSKLPYDLNSASYFICELQDDVSTHQYLIVLPSEQPNGQANMHREDPGQGSWKQLHCQGRQFSGFQSVSWVNPESVCQPPPFQTMEEFSHAGQPGLADTTLGIVKEYLRQSMRDGIPGLKKTIHPVAPPGGMLKTVLSGPRRHKPVLRPSNRANTAILAENRTVLLTNNPFQNLDLADDRGEVIVLHPPVAGFRPSKNSFDKDAVEVQRITVRSSGTELNPRLTPTAPPLPPMPPTKPKPKELQ